MQPPEETFEIKDKGAPKSPWGKIISRRKILDGVQFMVSPKDSGFLLTSASGLKYLSFAALKEAEVWKSHYGFRGTLGMSLVAREKPEWLEMAGVVLSPPDIQLIKSRFPEYCKTKGI